MATIERRNLAPVTPSTTLTETDRSRVYDVIRRHLADVLMGNQSYYPDGVQRDLRSRAADLEGFISSMKNLQNHVNDPSNIIGEAANDLRKYADAFQRQIEESEPADNIQIPPESSPNTSDNNIIYVDPDPGPYSPPNPVAPSQRPRDLIASLQSPGSRGSAFFGLMPGRFVEPPIRAISSPVGNLNHSSSGQAGSQPIIDDLGGVSRGRNHLISGIGDWVAAVTGLYPTNSMQLAPRQADQLRGIVSNEPMPDWPFPPPIFNRR